MSSSFLFNKDTLEEEQPLLLSASSTYMYFHSLLFILYMYM